MELLLATRPKMVKNKIITGYTLQIGDIKLKNRCACDFLLADAVYFTGRVAVTAINWVTHWENWAKFASPLEMDPYLQGI